MQRSLLHDGIVSIFNLYCTLHHTIPLQLNIKRRHGMFSLEEKVSLNDTNYTGRSLFGLVLDSRRFTGEKCQLEHVRFDILGVSIVYVVRKY